MKKIIMSLILSLASITASAEYIMSIPLERSGGGALPSGSIKFVNEIKNSDNWVEIEPTYTAWIVQGGVSGCSNWSPLEETINYGQTFIQTATDCIQEQIRTKQEREKETKSETIRNKGPEVIEKQIITVSSTRNNTGIKQNWIAIAPNYTDWVNIGDVKKCTNWSPETSTVEEGKSFTQTATDCQQDQTRSKQEREQETTILTIRNVGNPISEIQTITTSSTRNAIGTKETYLFDASLLVGKYYSKNQYATVDQYGYILLTNSYAGKLTPNTFSGVTVRNMIENAPPNVWENHIIVQLNGTLATINKVKVVTVNGVRYQLNSGGWVKTTYGDFYTGHFIGGTAPFRNSANKTVNIKFLEK